MQYVNNNDTDLPEHLHSLISAFVVLCLDSLIPILGKSKVPIAEQAGSRLCWLQPTEDRFSCDGAHV